MAITGIDTIDGKQIIAAGASSATNAYLAQLTTGGNSLQSLYDTVSTSSGSWGGGGGGVVTATGGDGTYVTSINEKPISGLGLITSISTGTYRHIEGQPLLTAVTGLNDFDGILAISSISALMANHASSATSAYKLTNTAINVASATSANYALAVSNGVTSADVTGTAQYGLTTGGWTEITEGGSLPASADEACQVVTANSADWNEVSAKTDMNTVLGNCIRYLSKPESGAIEARQNNLVNVGQIVGLGDSIFAIVPSAALRVPEIITAYDNGITANSLTANSTGIYSPHLTADNIKFLYSADGPGIYTVNSGFDNNTYALCQSSNSWQFGIGGPSAAFYATGALGLTDISTQDRYLGKILPSITVSSNYGALKLNSTGGEFILNPTSNNSAVNWRIGESTYLWNGQGDPNYNMPLLLAAMPKSQSWSNAPFISANHDHIELTKGTSGPRAIVDAQYYSGGYSSSNVYYYIGLNGIGCSGNSMDVQVYVPNQTATYSLRNSIQKTDIDGDSATSAISAIAGSALTCELPADLVYTATLSATSGLLNDDIQTVSAAIPVLSSLNTEGITDIQLVNELPVDPVSSVLYLIPEA